MRLFKRKAVGLGHAIARIEELEDQLRKTNLQMKVLQYDKDNPPKFKVGDMVRFKYSDGEKFIGVVSENNRIMSAGWSLTFERFYTIIVDCNDIHKDISEDMIKLPKTKKS